MKFGRLYIGCSFPILIGILSVMGEEQFIFSVFTASAVHELAHIAAIRILEGRIIGVKLNCTGAVINYQYSKKSYIKDMITAAAGPAAGILLACISALIRDSLLTGSSAMISIFNLLPVQFTDGGRIIYALTAYYAGTEKANSVMVICSCISSVIILFLSIIASSYNSYSGLLLFAAGSAFLGITVYSVARKKTEVYNQS